MKLHSRQHLLSYMLHRDWTCDCSPVNDKHRTFDLPVEEYYKLSTAYVWKGKNKLNYALGATLMMIGDAKIDQASQGVRTAGKFDQNCIFLLVAL